MERQRKARGQVHVHKESLSIHRSQDGETPISVNAMNPPAPICFSFLICWRLPPQSGLHQGKRRGALTEAILQVVRAEELVWYEEIKYNKRKRYATFW